MQPQLVRPHFLCDDCTNMSARHAWVIGQSPFGAFHSIKAIYYSPFHVSIGPADPAQAMQ